MAAIGESSDPLDFVSHTWLAKLYSVKLTKEQIRHLVFIRRLVDENKIRGEYFGPRLSE